MSTNKEHEQTTALLPWYVNDTLVGKEAELVLKHLLHCEACQAERDRLYELQTLVQESDTPTADYRSSYQQVLQRINRAEKDKQSARDAELISTSRGFVPYALAASVLVCLIAGAAFINNVLSIRGTSDPIGEEFQTLSSDTVSLAGAGNGNTYRMELGFVSPIPAATMRRALVDTQSNIVSGPDAAGNYLVEVVVPGHMTHKDYLDGIQQIEGVQRARFVEN